MLQSTLGALHNLCFYQGYDDNEANETIWKFSGEISAVLCDILKNDSDLEFLKVEAIRVLGNITLNKTARLSFYQHDGIQLMLKFIKSNCYDLKVNSAGVLINILGDYDKRATFEKHNGPEILRETLIESLDHHDLVLATIACQCIWNFLLENTSTLENDGNFCKDIYDILIYHIDDEIDSEWSSNIWIEFVNVATDLIEKFQSNLQLELT